MKELEHSSEVTRAKNRKVLIALFSMFFVPVLFAYTAYFNGWFSTATRNFGELIVDSEVMDIEDFYIKRANGKLITGKEFETLYWWIIPVDPLNCDDKCLQLNLHTVNQTRKGLGKEAKRINQLLVLPGDTHRDMGDFPVGYSQFSRTGVKAQKNTRSGLDQDLPAGYIYLVDPLGNIFMRYPFISNKKSAPEMSKGLRKDILRLFKYSRLG